MKPWHHFTDFSWIGKYSGQEIDLYSSFNKNKSMLEEIVQTTVTATAITATAGSGYIFWLAYKQAKAEKDSPKIETEIEAHNYFSHLIYYYNLDLSNFEFRPTYHGRDYLKRHPQDENKYIVFINMQKGTTRARMRHELLHYVNGDTRFDYENSDTFPGKVLSILHYAFVAEPRIIRDSKEEI